MDSVTSTPEGPDPVRPAGSTVPGAYSASSGVSTAWLWTVLCTAGGTSTVVGVVHGTDITVYASSSDHVVALGATSVAAVVILTAVEPIPIARSASVGWLLSVAI